MPRDPSVDRARLLRAAQRGDPGARHRIVASHLELVRAVARRYEGLGLPREDLVQEGCVGLLDAIDRYDRGRGVPFQAFARFRVKVAIRGALTARARLIRLPKHVLEQPHTGANPLPVAVALDDDLQPAADGLDPEEQVLAVERSRLIDDAVARLPPRQRLVITHRFGIGGSEESLGEIANALRISPRRTRTLEQQALAALRRELETA